MKISLIKAIKQLDGLTTAFSGITDTTKMVKSVQKILEEIFMFDHSGIYLFDPSENRLKQFQAQGSGKNKLTKLDEPVLEHHHEQVYQSKQKLYIPDIFHGSDQQNTSGEHSLNIRSRLILPVLNGEVALGVIEIADAKPNAYNDDDITVLSFINNLTGGKICRFDS